MKILITGVNGFVGSCLANYLITKGFKITGIGRQETLAKHVDKRCHYIKCDITTSLQDIDAEIVIHSAALATDNEHYEAFYKNNVIGTQNVLAACKNAHTFIQISTSSVYAFTNMPAVEEEAGKNFELLSNYGKTKYIAEQLVHDADINNKYILRPRAIYGKNDRIITPKLLRLKKGRYIILPKHITTCTSLTHIDNLVEAVYLCITRKHTNKETVTLNIADKKPYHLGLAITNLINAVTFTSNKIFYIPKTIWNLLIRLNQYIHFNKALTKFGSNEITKMAELDINKATKAIGYAANHNMDLHLQDIADWVMQNGGWKRYRDKKI